MPDSPPPPLPLFPLRTVLLPGGLLALRVFEPRYLGMVERCTREGSSFGVCLILEGEEVGRPALPAHTGTEAKIVDFAQREPGVLGIAVEGSGASASSAPRCRPMA